MYCLGINVLPIRVALCYLCCLLCPEHTVRRYTMSYIPPGFWPRLITRLMTFPAAVFSKVRHRSISAPILTSIFMLCVLFFAQEPTSAEFWKTGIYQFWNKTIFCLVEQLPGNQKIFDITVPTTMQGARLLCLVVDNIEALLDEWFPGLRSIDATCGEELVKPCAVCPTCVDPAYFFSITELTEASLSSDHIFCPAHKGKVPLEQLVSGGHFERDCRHMIGHLAEMCQPADP